ncbi:hypothetical protein GC105_16305 [Alkalibaculum sp. M08DMB]|uniref:Uncharacterized protein n=1 Tax=Alkalibaculum sporogenes TaxID=2655001 RepID=A0A6A7KCR8_9FIRM|nr:hypothetical protein [Alkalibaculum sporogenes]MPW27329.1 hypothetical protein [Alkalibaculum sporogenes]
MKKSILLSFILLSIFAFWGCANDQLRNEFGDYYISPAQLTSNQEELLDLTIDSNEKGMIYDYRVSENIKSILFEVTEYSYGDNPIVVSHGELFFSETEGQFYLSYDNTSEKLRLALRSGSGTSRITLESDPKDKDNDNPRSQLYLSSNYKIIAGDKIPISLVLEGNSEEMSIWNMEKYLEEPELLKEYTKAHLVTITFGEDEL